MKSSVVTPGQTEQDLQSTSVLTATIVLATVTMTFGAMVAVFFYRSAYATFWGHIHLPNVLWLSTAVLLVSSWTLRSATHALRVDDQPQAFRFLKWTAGLGFAFLAGQILAWFQVVRAGLVLRENPHSWFIFFFTGLHGLHILLGLAGLAILLVRTRERATGPKYVAKTRAIASGVSIFWHYLDGLWIVLFALLLLWRR